MTAKASKLPYAHTCKHTSHPPMKLDVLLKHGTRFWGGAHWFALAIGKGHRWFPLFLHHFSDVLRRSPLEWTHMPP